MSLEAGEHGFELGADETESVAANQQVFRWLLHADEGQYRLRGLFGIAQMLRLLRTIERPAQSVRKEPGATAVTATPKSFISLARVSEIPSSANLLPQ